MHANPTGAPEAQSWRRHISATLQLGLPLVGAQLAQIAIATTDTVMIGWLGARQLAAGVLGAQSFFMVLMLGSGFAFAVMPMVAQSHGAGDDRSVRRSTRMGLWIVAIYAAVMMVPLWHIQAFLVATGQDPKIAALSGEYIRIMQWALFPALFTMTMRSFLASLEHARIVLVATIMAAIVNALLNYMLIFGNWGAPALGLKGAAIGSVASSTLSFVFLFTYSVVTPAIARYELQVRFWRPDWQAFREVFQLGWPISITVIAEVGLFAASSLLMGWVGTIELAAHGIALQLASLVFMVPLGLANAGTIRVGNARGRGDAANMRRAALSVLAIAAIVGVMGAVLFVTWPQPLVGLFVDESNPGGADVAAYAAPLLAVAATFQLFDCLQVVGAGLLRGLKDMRMAMVVATVSYWGVGMPLAYYLAFAVGLGGIGVWFGLASGLAVAAVCLNLRYFYLARR
jgi:MATE family, multidrug efflux pump